MSYEIDEIKSSQRIFYHLLKNSMIKENSESELYKLYSQNEKIMNLVKQQGELCECNVEKYSGVIYLIPKEDNDFLGFSKGELKKELCKSNANDKDYYLSQFVIMTILVEFYGSQGKTSKSREYLKGGELLNIISQRLKDGIDRTNDEDEDLNGIAFSNMLERFDALKSSDVNSRSKTTKEGFIYSILKFLQNQGLIDFIEAEDMIITTKKLDNFMDWNILNKNNYYRVLKVLGEYNDEQD